MVNLDSKPHYPTCRNGANAPAELAGWGPEEGQNPGALCCAILMPILVRQCFRLGLNADRCQVLWYVSLEKLPSRVL